MGCGQRSPPPWSATNSGGATPPAIAALEERVAEVLGHETAVFLPSGTMCNEIALRLHIRPGGDELIVDRTAHPVNSEAGGPAALAGAMVRTLGGDGGIFTADQLRAAVRSPGSRYMPRSRLAWVEQTTNTGGGRVWPVQAIREVLGAARDLQLRAHLDGARLMNAVVASGVQPASTPAASTPRGSTSPRGWERRSAPYWPAPTS